MRAIRASLMVLTIAVFAAVTVSQNRQTHDVNISLNGSQIQVSPADVTMNRGDRLRWRASGNQADRYEIDIGSANGVKGPFASSNGGDNPNRGRYNKNVQGTIVTRPAEVSGTWKYTIHWIRADGTRLVLDPAIIVR